MRPTQKITYERLVKAVSGAEYRTLQSIGDEFGLTRERIRQLINKHNLHTAPARQIPDPRKNCRYCGELVGSTKSKRVWAYYNYFHKLCRAKYLKERSESFWLTIPCSYCNKNIRLRKSSGRLKARKQDYLFCSHSCSAKYRIENETDDFGVWTKGDKKSHPYFQKPRI